MQTLEIQFRSTLSNVAKSAVEKVPGAKDADDGFVLQILEERIPLRELIARTVCERLRLSRIKYADQIERHERARHAEKREFLEEEDIRARAKDGKIGLRLEVGAVPDPVLDEEKEIARAIKSFRAHEYLVLINGRQCDDLDDDLNFEAQTKVTYLRLTPLVGG